MPLTARDIHTYLNRKAMAEHPGTPTTERSNAKQQVLEMERENPDIRAKAAAVKKVLEADGEDPFQPAPPGGGGWREQVGKAVGNFVQGVAQQSASRFADEVAGELSGANRFRPLAKGECVLTAHTCPDDQVCLEIRVSKKGVRKASSRDDILDGIEAKLVALAEK